MKDQNTIKSLGQRTRWWGKATALGAFLALGLGSNAQTITNYSRTVLNSQTFTAISSPTTRTSTTVPASPAFTGTSDDGRQAGITLPWTFTFDGVGYTAVVMGTNGWLTFGADQGTNDLTAGNAFTTTVVNRAVHMWHGDGNANFGVTTPNGAGTLQWGADASGDLFICQWNNNSGSASGATSTANSINYQVVLHGPTSATPGRIDMIYGASTGTISTGRSIAIEDAVGGTGRYINALNGLSNSTTTASAWPGNGNGYRFDPPVPCTGIPNAGSVSTPISVCGGSTAILSATGLTTGIGITYQWEESPDGIGSWAAVVGGSGATTATYTTTAITATRYFRIKTTCSTGPDENVSNVVTVNADPGSFNEDFSSGNLIANCWTPTINANLLYSPSSAFAVGTGSIRWNFFNSPVSTVLSMTSPLIDPVGSGQEISFDVAGRSYTGGEIDEIYLEESNDGGTNWTLVALMTNEVGDVLNTAGSSTSNLTAPTAGEWASLSYTLTAGTNRVRFRGVSDFGNSVLIDNIALPEACTGPVDPGATESTTVLACNGVDFTLSLENATTGSGVSYQWFASTTSAAGPFDITGPTTATWTTNQAVTTWYYCEVTCANGPATGSSDVLEIAVDIPSNCYCEPTYTFGKTDGDLLSNVVIVGTTLANNTGTSPTNPAYTYFNTLPNHTADLQAGTSYTIQATVGTFASQNIAVWIDFNENGVFETPGERVGFTTTSIGANGTGSFVLSLPCDPTPGVKRMRVRDVWNLAGNLIDPCANYGYGETEDYDVTILAPPACPSPSSLAFNTVTFNSANITWNIGCAETAWEIEYGPTGFTLGSGTTVSATSPYALTGLSSSFGYDVYVRADCGIDGLSASVGPVNFTTSPAPPANDDCAGAIGLTVNPDFGCAVVTAGTNVASTASAQASTGISGTANTDVWYSFVATNASHRISLINIVAQGGAFNSTDMGMALYTGSAADCASNSLTFFGTSDPETWNVSGLSVGATYYLRVYGWSSSLTFQNFNVCIGTPPPPPANDDCAGAIALTVNGDFACGTVTAGTTTSATASPQPDVDSGTPDDDVWFSFVATATSHRVSLLNVSPFTDMGHSVYRALPDPCAATGMTLVLTSDPDVSNPAGLTIGETYFVRVYAWGTGPSSVNFNICIGTQPPVPANDLCANAIAVNCNSITAGTTAGGSTTGAPGTCTTSLNTAPGVWYTVQGWGGQMVANVCGAGFDTKIGVFTGSCGSLVCVVGNDDFCGVQSQVTWTSTAATTYYIYVTGFSTNSGAFDLEVSCGSNDVSCAANGLTLEFQTDATPAQNTWEIRNTAGTVVAVGGGPLVAPTGIQTQALCLPDGCYTLRVFDSAGDGIANGGYTLREAGPVSLDTRIIDNFRNFSSGSVSAIGNGPSAFCLPIGTQKPIFTSRDKLDWLSNQYLVAEPDAAVSAEWIEGAPNNLQSSTTGYQFWFFDPNGTYSFRRGRYHNTSDNFGPANEFRACHMRINNWVVANQIPENVLMNVRIRTRVNSVYGEFGPAYQFKIDPVAAACPTTKLNDIPNQPALSCNQTRNWGPGNFVHARQVSGANRYQFRFRLPAEGYIKVVTSNTYFQQLNWATAPLEAGKTYEVQVRASKDGGATWCYSGAVWGPSCTITINTPAQDAEQNLGLNTISTGSLAMWPNPNRGDQLWIDLNGIEAGVENVAVDIMDMTGKQIVARILPTQGDRLNTVLNLNGDLATGMYLVNITAGDKRYTERLVIAN